MWEAKDSKSETGYSLAVVYAATHSGLLNGNNAFYLPAEQKRGITSWTKPYLKPLGESHYSDNIIGRVRFANYVDLSGSIKNARTQKWLDILNSDDFDREGDLADIRKAAQYVATKMSKKNNYQGLGYNQVGAVITDPDAIQKAIDGRYLTVSIVKYVDDVVCSVCGRHWRRDGLCDHQMGEVDKDTGYMGFRIPIGYNYGRLDYATTPADQFAMQLAIGENFDDLTPMETIFKSNYKDSLVAPVMDADYFAAKGKELVELRSDKFMNIADSLQIDGISKLFTEDAMTHPNDVEENIVEELVEESVEEDETEEVAEETAEPEVVDNTPTQTEEPVVDNTEGQEEEAVQEEEKKQFSVLLNSLKTLAPYVFYQENILPLLETDNAITEEEFGQMDASMFADPGKALPICDKQHIEAIKKLFDGYTESNISKRLLKTVQLAEKKMTVAEDEVLSHLNEISEIQDKINTILEMELRDEDIKALVAAIYPVVTKYEDETPVSELKYELEIASKLCDNLVVENDSLIASGGIELEDQEEEPAPEEEVATEQDEETEEENAPEVNEVDINTETATIEDSAGVVVNKNEQNVVNFQKQLDEINVKTLMIESQKGKLAAQTYFNRAVAKLNDSMRNTEE